MNIVEEIKKLYQDETQRNIIFWYDTISDRDLDPIIKEVEQQGTQFWELTDRNEFTTKYQLEVVDPNQSYLIYARFPKPKSEENGLLDSLLYSQEFNADDISILIHRYELQHLTVREFLQENRKFFNDKKRAVKLEELLPSTPTEEQLKLGMMAVLVGTPSLQLPVIIRKLLTKGLDEEQNKAYHDLSRSFDLEVFWNIVYQYFGVEKRDKTLSGLFQTFIYNHFVLELDLELPKSFAYQYPSKLPNTSRIFIEDWFNSDDSNILDGFLATYEAMWDIHSILTDQPYESFFRCDTFKIIDRLIILKLSEELEKETAVYDKWKDTLTLRKIKHWAKQEPFSIYYQTLEIALNLHVEKGNFNLMSAPRYAVDWIEQYTEKLYHIDQLYRQLMWKYQSANNPDFLTPFIQKLSDWYVHVYLVKIAQWTDQLLDQQLLEQWPVEQILQQKDFYSNKIQPLVENTQERIFVIISDALRFEVGQELYETLNARLNSEVTITPMQASLPCYTQLGMASLLPGKELSIDENGTVYKDGLSTKGLVNRNKVLKRNEPDSIALNLHELLSLTKEEGSSLLKGKRVVYLYHDRIDNIGDTQKSEHQTFEAVQLALSDLEGAVQKLVGRFAAVRIFITSDHGFLYQPLVVEAHDKTLAIPEKTYDGNRRFAIGKDLTVPPGSKKLSLDYLGLQMEAVITIGLNRFQTKGGGLRFVHGGALPQEAIVPVIAYRQVRGIGKKDEAERVDVRVSTKEKIMTSYRFKVVLFQEQKVDEDKLPRHVRIAFYLEEQRISNEMTITIDSEEEATSRQTEVIFTLQEHAYDIGQRCTLRIEDVSTPKKKLYKEEDFELRIYDAFL